MQSWEDWLLRPRPTGASSTVADDSGKGSLVTACIWDEKQSHGGRARDKDTPNTQFMYVHSIIGTSQSHTVSTKHSRTSPTKMSLSCSAAFKMYVLIDFACRHCIFRKAFAKGCVSCKPFLLSFFKTKKTVFSLEFCPPRRLPCKRHAALR